MNQTIVRIPPWAAARVLGVIYLILGIVFLPFVFVPILVAGEQAPFGIAFVVVMPLVYGALGFLGSAFFCWLYNMVSRRMGGIEIELAAESHH